MSGSNKHLLNKVLILDLSRCLTPSTSALCRIRFERLRLGVTQVRYSDDNVFFASFTTNPPVNTVITPGGQGDWWVALGDSFSSGEGADWFYDGTNTSRNGCHRSDAYASLANASLGSPFDAVHLQAGDLHGKDLNGETDSGSR